MISSSQQDQPHRRAVVWIDHLKAKVFGIGLSGVSSTTIHAQLSSSHLHHYANTIGSGHVKDDHAFFPAIAKAIENCSDVLILGPGTEKVALKDFLESVRPKIVLRLEASDHPTDEEIVAIGLSRFGLSLPRA